MDPQELAGLLARYREIRESGGQELIIALLREIQQAQGCVPESLYPAVAEAMGTAPAAVAALVRKIPGLRGAPARVVVTVCTGPRCAAKGGREILAAFERALGVRAGASTPDGAFALETQNCFKRCGGAPNIRCGRKIYARFSPGQVPGLLAQYRGRPPAN